MNQTTNYSPYKISTEILCLACGVRKAKPEGFLGGKMKCFSRACRGAVAIHRSVVPPASQSEAVLQEVAEGKSAQAEAAALREKSVAAGITLDLILQIWARVFGKPAEALTVADRRDAEQVKFRQGFVYVARGCGFAWREMPIRDGFLSRGRAVERMARDKEFEGKVMVAEGLLKARKAN